MAETHRHLVKQPVLTSGLPQPQLSHLLTAHPEPREVLWGSDGWVRSGAALRGGAAGEGDLGGGRGAVPMTSEEHRPSSRGRYGPGR